MTQTKKTKLRHAEYYGLQETFDDLYARSKRGETFGQLMEIIASDANIMLAYRNIKGHKGSYTAGTDGRGIGHLAVMKEEEFVPYIKSQFTNYQPKAVRRVEIPKPNGKMRPLGIPCITDRVVQQCILQVLEPICEARFHDRSHGFRPDHSAEHAIADCYRLMQRSGMHYVVDVDIEGFFDNVDHRKLMQQLWSMGVRDTKLLMIIRTMLKAPIRMPDGDIVSPTKGTPQGGVLSPLLANVVLNELDWWVSSQWEGQPERLRKRYYRKENSNGSFNHGGAYRAMKRTNLKEMFIVRYADDFKIFCRNPKDAEKTFEAVRQWLEHRLKLRVSPEKSRVTDLKKRYCEFLGFKIKLTPKGKTERGETKYVVRSHVCDKALKQTKEQLTELIRSIASPNDNRDLIRRVAEYNAVIVGKHNYYEIATCVQMDFDKVDWSIRKRIEHQLQPKKSGNWHSQYLKERYGKSKSVRWVYDTPLMPLGYVQHRNPMCKRRATNSYTPEGREAIHASLTASVDVMLHLMKNPVRDRSIEYNDNRISRFASQNGLCAITNIELLPEEVHCHHRIPLSMGGNDRYDNLVVVHEEAHRLIHATKEETIAKYVQNLGLSPKQIKKVNKYREQAGLPPIKVCES